MKPKKINNHCWENLKTYMQTIHCMNYRFLTNAECYCNTNLHSTSHVHTARVLGFKFLRSEILTAVLLEIQVVWDVTQGCQEINAQHFEGSSCLHLQQEVVHEQWQWWHYDPLEPLELHDQWEILISQKTWSYNPICYIPIKWHKCLSVTTTILCFK
jgi:hypothetical protein